MKSLTLQPIRKRFSIYKQDIPITVQLTYGQNGFFDFKLCAEDDATSHLDPNCYNRNIVTISGHGEKYFITEMAPKYYNLTLQLPVNIKCNKCVLRWRYRTGKQVVVFSHVLCLMIFCCKVRIGEVVVQEDQMLQDVDRNLLFMDVLTLQLSKVFL